MLDENGTHAFPSGADGDDDCSCDADSQHDIFLGLSFIEAENPCRNGSRPRSGDRKRDGNEKHQAEISVLFELRRDFHLRLDEKTVEPPPVDGYLAQRGIDPLKEPPGKERDQSVRRHADRGDHIPLDTEEISVWDASPKLADRDKGQKYAPEEGFYVHTTLP